MGSRLIPLLGLAACNRVTLPTPATPAAPSAVAVVEAEPRPEREDEEGLPSGPPALTKIHRVEVRERAEVEVAGRYVLAYTFNVMEAELAGLDESEVPDGDMEAETECAERRAELDDGIRDRLYREVGSCSDVVAAYELALAPNAAHCDRLGIAVLDANHRLLTHRVFEDQPCYDDSRPTLEHRDFTGDGVSELVLQADLKGFEVTEAGKPMWPTHQRVWVISLPEDGKALPIALEVDIHAYDESQETQTFTILDVVPGKHLDALHFGRDLTCEQQTSDENEESCWRWWATRRRWDAEARRYDEPEDGSPMSEAAARKRFDELEEATGGPW